MTTAYISHPDCLKHDMGSQHPECPARMTAIEGQLSKSGVLKKLIRHEATKASKEQLARVHSKDYIERIISTSPRSGLVHLDGDTAMNTHSLDAAFFAAGAGINAVDLVMTDAVDNAFCNVRPPGHHAARANSAGFCIFNNIAVAAAHALEFYGLKHVAIADFDVHHGNGTEAIFHDDPRVMLCSTFRHPYYPYSGADSSNDHIINVPLAAGSAGDEFRAAVIEQWFPALERFKPELLLISAGFDAHAEDDMGGLSLIEDDYVWVTENLKAVAQRYARGRIVSMLEGGYALNALARSVAAHIQCLSAP
ncbi:Histone deacetylase-like amidohydrolase [biofilm metagenome]